MADNRLAEAVDAMAKHVIRNVVHDSMEAGELWADYPEMGEDDWIRVVERAGELTDLLYPDSPDTVAAAYDYLTERAEQQNA